MTWIRLDDNFADHPKISGLPPASFKLHVAGLCYCGRHLTDGLIAAEEVPKLMRNYRQSYLDELINRLVWHALDAGHAYQIHDYLDYNLSRTQHALRIQTGRNSAQRRWGQTRDD